MYGFNTTPLNSTYSQVLSTPGQGSNFASNLGTGFGFGSGGVYNNGSNYVNQAQSLGNLITNAQNRTNTGNQYTNRSLADLISSYQNQVGGTQRTSAWDTLVQNYLQQNPVSSQQAQVATTTPVAATTTTPATEVASASSGLSGSTDAVQASQSSFDPYENLPEAIREAISKYPDQAEWIARNYQDSLERGLYGRSRAAPTWGPFGTRRYD